MIGNYEHAVGRISCIDLVQLLVYNPFHNKSEESLFMSNSRYKTTYGTFDMFLDSSIRAKLPLYFSDKPKIIPAVVNDVAKNVAAFGGFITESSSGIDSYAPKKHRRGFMKKVRELHLVLEQLYSILQKMVKGKISRDTAAESSFCNIVKEAFMAAAKEERKRVFQNENPSAQESKGENKLEFTNRIITEILTAIREAKDMFSCDGQRDLIDHEDYFEKILEARTAETKASYSLKR